MSIFTAFINKRYDWEFSHIISFFHCFLRISYHFLHSSVKHVPNKLVSPYSLRSQWLSLPCTSDSLVFLLTPHVSSRDRFINFSSSERCVFLSHSQTIILILSAVNRRVKVQYTVKLPLLQSFVVFYLYVYCPNYVQIKYNAQEIMKYVTSMEQLFGCSAFLHR